MHKPLLLKATMKDISELEKLVAAYHAFDGIESTAEKRKAAISGLLDNPSLGCLFLITLMDEIIGYLALCYSYSIEFCGRDVFIDEFYIKDNWRRHGYGTHILAAAKAEALSVGGVSLTLEVEKSNKKAKHFYETNGFQMRDGYHFMSCLLDTEAVNDL